MDPVVRFGIGGLAMAVAAVVAGMVWVADRRRFPAVLGAIIAIMAIQFAAAASGLLRPWDRTPPLIAPLIAIALVLTVLLDAVVGKLSVSALVAFQVFRLPLELVMHRAATHGIMPMQMSYSGYNFDVISGALALPVAWAASRSRQGRVYAWIWNLAGLVLLANIVVIAVISMPSIAAFGPENLNTWVADPPYIWLPGVLVPCALLGHLLVFRALRRRTP